MNIVVEMVGGTIQSFKDVNLKFEGAFVVVTDADMNIVAFPATNVTRVTATPVPVAP